MLSGAILPIHLTSPRDPRTVTMSPTWIVELWGGLVITSGEIGTCVLSLDVVLLSEPEKKCEIKTNTNKIK